MTATGTPAAPVVRRIGLGEQGPPRAVALAETGRPPHARHRRAEALGALAGVPHVSRAGAAGPAAVCDVVGLCVRTDADMLAPADSPLNERPFS